MPASAVMMALASSMDTSTISSSLSLEDDEPLPMSSASDMALVAAVALSPRAGRAQHRRICALWDNAHELLGSAAHGAAHGQCAGSIKIRARPAMPACMRSGDGWITWEPRVRHSPGIFFWGPAPLVQQPYIC